MVSYLSASSKSHNRCCPPIVCLNSLRGIARYFTLINFPAMWYGKATASLKPCPWNSVVPLRTPARSSVGKLIILAANQAMAVDDNTPLEPAMVAQKRGFLVARVNIDRQALQLGIPSSMRASWAHRARLPDTPGHHAMFPRQNIEYFTQIPQLSFVMDLTSYYIMPICRCLREFSIPATSHFAGQ